MQNNTTELVFVLDRSGSMGGLEADTIGGFNAMIRKQQSQEGKAYVSTVLFNSESRVIHDRADVHKVEPMTDAQYTVGGCTALLDAIGDAVHHIGNVHKYARPEDVPAHTLFVITTDGMENASHRYSADEVRALLRRKQEECGWEFLFLGANIDAVQTAKHIGIAEDHAVDYCCDAPGTALNFTVLAEAVSDVRKGKGVRKGWNRKIREDYARRN